MRSPLLTAALQLSTRAALGATLAYWIAQSLQLDYAIYALVSAIIVTDLSPAESRRQAWRRLAGTVLGAVVGALLTYVQHSGVLAVALGIFIAVFISHLLHLQGAAKITGYVAAIVVLTHTRDPWVYAFYRALETALGIAVALLVSFVPKLMRPEEPGQE